MTVTFEDYGVTYRRETVELAAIPDLYAEAGRRGSTCLTWGDCTDEVLIVGVGEDYSVITLKRDETFFDVQITTDEDLRQIEIGGLTTDYPAGLILPRQMGLAALQLLPDLDAVWAAFEWRVND
jgi:hypothetical protein